MKSIFKSKTVWGAIASAIIGLCAIFDVRISEEETVPVVEAIGVILVFGFTLYGRLKASVPVKIGKLRGDSMLLWMMGALFIAIATVPQTGCTVVEKYGDWAESNPKAAQMLESAAHAAIIYAINNQAQKSDTVALHQEALKEAANAAFAEGATVADVASLIAEEVFSIYPDDPETRSILLAGFDQALSDPAGSGIPASDTERVQAALLSAELEVAFIELSQI